MSEERKAGPEPETKQPYDQPAVTTEEVFETLALVCCKTETCVPVGEPGQTASS